MSISRWYNQIFKKFLDISGSRYQQKMEELSSDKNFSY